MHLFNRIFGLKQSDTNEHHSTKTAKVLASYPPGHFYSPIVDPQSLRSREDWLWRGKDGLYGVDFNDVFHEYVIRILFPEYFPMFDYSENRVGENQHEYFLKNGQFGWLDAHALFVFLNYWKPKRMIEVGSGFSSLLTADVNRRFLDNQLEFTCIEPYPRSFLTTDVPGISGVIVKRVEETPLDIFKSLGNGDILFIDSSHVAKTGSDVNYLFFEVLPVLAEGVLIHFHDIFLPQEYPKQWVLEENRSWNEQYLLQALLMHSDTYKVQFGCNYARVVFPALLEDAMGLQPGQAYGGGSFWITKSKTEWRV